MFQYDNLEGTKKTSIEREDRGERVEFESGQNGSRGGFGWNFRRQDQRQTCDNDQCYEAKEQKKQAKFC